MCARASRSHISRSALGPTPRFSPRPGRCPRWASAPMSCILSSSWNNPEPEVALVVASGGTIARRDARQRRQSARCRGPFGAAARQGQGQQRVGLARPVHPAVRHDFSLDDVGRPRSTSRSTARMASCSRGILDEPDVASAGPGRRRRSAASPISRRLRDLSRHMFAPVEGPRRAGKGFTHKTGDIVTISPPKLARFPTACASRRARPGPTAAAI